VYVIPVQCEMSGRVKRGAAVRAEQTIQQTLGSKRKGKENDEVSQTPKKKAKPSEPTPKRSRSVSRTPKKTFRKTPARPKKNQSVQPDPEIEVSPEVEQLVQAQSLQEELDSRVILETQQAFARIQKEAFQLLEESKSLSDGASEQLVELKAPSPPHGLHLAPASSSRRSSFSLPELIQKAKQEVSSLISIPRCEVYAHDDNFPGMLLDGLSGLRVLSASLGLEHSLLLTNDGRIFAWGSNTKYACGVSKAAEGSELHIPQGVVQPQSLSAFAILSQKPHAEVAGEDAWVEVDIIQEHQICFTQIACGDYHSIALTDQGSVFCWGTYIGAPNAPENFRLEIPTQFIEAGEVIATQICSSRNTSLALLSDGNVLSWGTSDDLSLIKKPQRVQGLQDMAKCVFSSNGCNFVFTDDSCFAWGNNSNGILDVLSGNKLENLVGSPVRIDAFNGLDVISLVIGRNHGLCLTSNGRVFGFGGNDFGQLGEGDAYVLKEISFYSKVKSIAAGDGYSLVKLETGDAMCFGRTSVFGLTNEMSVGEPQLLKPQACKDCGRVTQILANGQNWYLILEQASSTTSTISSQEQVQHEENPIKKLRKSIGQVVSSIIEF